MVLDFLVSLGPVNFIVITAALVVFIYWFKSLISLLKGCFFVGIASAIFPVAAVKFFGFSMTLNVDTLVGFVSLGLGLYFIFMFGKTVHRVLSIGIKPVSFLAKSFSGKPRSGGGKSSDPYHVDEEKLIIKKFRQKK